MHGSNGEGRHHHSAAAVSWSGQQQLSSHAEPPVSPASSSAVVIIAMAREEELKRIDLKVNVSCCDGCRRKVMKAMSLKGVLRTEIQPSHDRVTVVGDVDVKVLMKKLAKVGKIAELLPPAPAASEQGKKQRDEGEWKDGGDKPAPAQAAEEKCKGKDDGMGAGDKAAAKVAPSKHDGCKKCAREAAARGMPGGDNGDHGSVKKQAPSSKDAAGGGGEEGGDADGLFGAKPLAAAAADHHHAQAPQPQAHYHRAEPAMVVPAYYPPPPAAAAVPYYGYYGMPPPPPLTMMPMAPPAQRHPQLRPQPSRFDENYFDDDNTVGCSVM